MIWKHRYTISAILFFVYMLCYMDRMVMASAIPFIAKEFHLSPLAMGGVLSAFFAGYALMQLPGGLLADRFGPRAVVSGAIAWWSLMTAATGLSGGLTSLVVTRLFFGLGEGPFPASVSKALSIWIPRHELARVNGIQMGSTQLGAAIAPLFVVALIVSWGWRWVYFLLCAPGMLLAILVWTFLRNARGESRFVSPEELAEFDSAPPEKIGVVSSLREAFGTPAVLWCAACLFLSNIVGWGLANWLPTYLLSRGFSIGATGYVTSLTYLFGAISAAFGGWLSDRFFSHRLYIPIILSQIIGAVFIYLLAFAPTSSAATTYLLLSSLLGGFGSAAIFTIPIVAVRKEAVGGAFGIVNTAGQLAGVIAPVSVGYILSITHSNFVIVLCTMVGITLLSIIPAMMIRQRQPLEAAVSA